MDNMHLFQLDSWQGPGAALAACAAGWQEAPACPQATHVQLIARGSNEARAIIEAAVDDAIVVALVNLRVAYAGGHHNILLPSTWPGTCSRHSKP